MDKESTKIRNMFGLIAHRYDLLNHLLSLSVDRYWRRTTSRKLARWMPDDPLILDLCTGTGDLALTLAARGRIIGCDFCHSMLVLGIRKARKKGLKDKVRFVEGDVLQLPFSTGYFDAVTIAFGLRNLEDYRVGLREICRVLRDQGVFALLEFSMPQAPIFRQVYAFYFVRVLPRLGEWLSGQRGPYSYLSQSVMDFPDPNQMDQMIEEAGFGEVRHYGLTGGVATLYLSRKKAWK